MEKDAYKILKRILKNKQTVSLSLLVHFLITGNTYGNILNEFPNGIVVENEQKDIFGENIEIRQEVGDTQTTISGVTGSKKAIINLGNSETKNINIISKGTWARGVSLSGFGGEIDYGATLNINTDKLNIEVHGIEQARGLSVMTLTTNSKEGVSKLTIDAKDTVIDIKLDKPTSDEKATGIVAWSQGEVRINNGNILINADHLINTRGNSLVELNADGNIENKLKLNGDIVFAYDGVQSGTAVNSNVKINLTNPDSYLKGNIFITGNPPEEKDAVTGLELNVSNGAQWITKKDQENFVFGILKLKGGVFENNSLTKIYSLNGIEMEGAENEFNSILSGTGDLESIDKKETKLITVSGKGNILNFDKSTKLKGNILINSQATLENKGEFNLEGNLDNFGSIFLTKENSLNNTLKIYNGNFTNTENGILIIQGNGLVGIYADNSSLTNNGIIKLNIFQEDRKTLADNKAMYGVNNSVIKNNGSIYLTDIDSKWMSYEELEKLNAYVKSTLISGIDGSVVINNGTIRNAKGEIISASGGDITDIIPDLGVTENGDYDLTEDLVAGVEDKETPITTDKTLAFSGDKLDLNINADANFDKEKYLVSLNGNENILVTGNLIGADKGILVQNSNLVMEGAKIEVNVNNENNVALDFDSNSIGKLVETSVIGNININNASEVTLENSAVAGDITLDANSALAMDTSSTEKFYGMISGHNNGSKVVLGDGNTAEAINVTRFNGTIENIDNVETNGILVMEEKSNFINSSVNIGDENLLVIRVGKGENDYALSDNVGSINLSENGHMMIETGRVDIQDGDVIKLGTTIIGDLSNIHASEFIYDITLIDSESEVAGINSGSSLLVTLKSAEEVGLDSSVSDSYESLSSTGRLSGLVSVGAGKDKNELNSLLHQNVEGNAYVLGDKISRDSIKTWNDTVKNNINFLNPGEFKISGLGMGAFEDVNRNEDYKYSGTGLMVMGEYGYDSKATLGFSLGGGAVSGELNSDNKVNGDSFYLSAFGKKVINELLLSVNIGYQFNKLKGKRAIGNTYESYNFSENFDTNGFNVDLEGRYIYSLTNGFRLEPHLGVNVISVKQDSITENVADGALAMELDSFDSTTLETKVGVELAKNIVTTAGLKIKLFGDLSYINNSGDIDNDLTGKFVGASSDFKVRPIEIGKNKGELALGGKIKLTSGMFTDAKVAYSFGDNNYINISISLGYTF